MYQNNNHYVVERFTDVQWSKHFLIMLYLSKEKFSLHVINNDFWYFKNEFQKERYWEHLERYIIKTVANRQQIYAVIIGNKVQYKTNAVGFLIGSITA